MILTLVKILFDRLLSAIVCGLIALAMISCHPEETAEPEDVRQELEKRINSLREKGCMCGSQWMAPVKALQWNVLLEDAALLHAKDMHANNYFSHLSLNGAAAINRAQNAGYEGDYVGEVIAREYFTTQDVVNAWKESESHCLALMDSLYNEMGGARYETYWVVDLGKSK
jgi:uncharacterized protein YkwD